METRGTEVWDYEKNKKFIKFRAVDYAFLSDNLNSLKRQKAWKELKEKMDTNLTVEKMIKKWKYFIRKYMTIRSSFHDTEDPKGNNLKPSWKYYEYMHSILKDKILIHSDNSSSSAMQLSSLSEQEEGEHDVIDDESNYENFSPKIKIEKLVEDEMREIKKHCGEIFMTRGCILSFKCSFCPYDDDILFDEIHKFFSHIKQVHMNECNNENYLNSDEDDDIHNHRFNNYVEEQLIDNNLDKLKFETILVENLEDKNKNVDCSSNVKIENKSRLINLENDNFNESSTNDINEDVNINKNENEFLNERRGKKVEAVACLECHICKTKLMTESSLRAHMKRHFLYKTFACFYCDLKFNAASDRRKHERRIHLDKVESNANNIESSQVNKNSVEDQDNIDFKMISESQTNDFSKKEMSLNSDEEQFIENNDSTSPDISSKEINKDFQTNDKQTDNITNESSETRIYEISRPFRCDICSARFADKYFLKRHVNRHLQEKSFKCDYCEQRFNALADKQKHEKRIHSTELNKRTLISNAEKDDNFKVSLNRFICKFCKKLFRSHWEKDLHEVQCTGIKVLTCEICGKLFPTNSKLQYHLQCHNGIKPHKCHFCGVGFTLSSNLYIHLRRHTGEKTHKCSYCDKSFITSTEKKIHERTHNGENPYQCNECGKCFPSSGRLTNHNRSNHLTLAKTHQCNQCDKKFITPSRLKDHQYTHSKEKNFACDKCEAKFVTRKTLAQHKKLHLAVGAYVCTICDKRFKQLAGLYSHKKSHGIYLNENLK